MQTPLTQHQAPSTCWNTEKMKSGGKKYVYPRILDHQTGPWGFNRPSLFADIKKRTSRRKKPKESSCIHEVEVKRVLGLLLLGTRRMDGGGEIVDVEMRLKMWKGRYEL